LKSSTYKGGEKGNNTYPFTIYKSSFSPKTKDQRKSRAKKKSPIIGTGIVLIYYLEPEPDIIKVKY